MQSDDGKDDDRKGVELWILARFMGGCVFDIWGRDLLRWDKMTCIRSL
jgi:hypothetical protein